MIFGRFYDLKGNLYNVFGNFKLILISKYMCTASRYNNHINKAYFLKPPFAIKLKALPNEIPLNISCNIINLIEMIFKYVRKCYI